MTRLLDKFCLAAGAAAVISGAAALIAAPGFAQTGAASVVVRYDDVALSKPGAAEALQRRIEVAAADVCGGQPDIRDLDRKPAFDACREDAAHRAVSQLRANRALALTRGAGISPLAHR